MFVSFKQSARFLFVLSWGLCLVACSVQLAPLYNKAIADSLVSVNQQAMTLFASASSGTTRDTYAQRDAAYNSLIGNLDALALQAKSRPVPDASVNEKVNAFLSKRGVSLPASGDAPSAMALEQISITVAKMRDTDKKQGLTAFEVAAFKGQVVIYLDQALTYENFLTREVN